MKHEPKPKRALLTTWEGDEQAPFPVSFASQLAALRAWALANDLEPSETVTRSCGCPPSDRSLRYSSLSAHAEHDGASVIIAPSLLALAPGSEPVVREYDAYGMRVVEIALPVDV